MKLYFYMCYVPKFRFVVDINSFTPDNDFSHFHLLGAHIAEVIPAGMELLEESRGQKALPATRWLRGTYIPVY